MKLKKRLFLPLLFSALLVLLSACGSKFDPQAYTESYMTLLATGDTGSYTELSGQSEEDVQSLRSAALSSMDAVLNDYKVGDEAKEAFLSAYDQALAKAQYTVGEATETEDGYEVTVEVQPITGLFDAIPDHLSELQSVIHADQTVEEELYDWLFTQLSGDITAQTEGELSYGDAQTFTVKLVKDDKGQYSIEDAETLSQNIGTAFADQSSLSEQVGSYGATCFTEAYLALITRGDTALLAKVTGQSQETTSKQYDVFLDSMKTALTGSGMEVSQETQEKLIDAYVKVLSKSKYTVSPGVSSGSGYAVDVSVSPITGMYESIMESLQTEAVNAYVSGEINDDTMYDWMFGKMADLMLQQMDSLTYGDPKTVTLQLTPVGGIFSIDNENDAGYEIGTLLIDQSGIS